MNSILLIVVHNLWLIQKYSIQKKECLEALNEYPLLFFVNNIKDDNSEYVEILKDNNGKYYAQYFDKKGRKLFHSRKHVEKAKCKKAMERFYTYRNEFCTNCLEEID